MGGLPLHPAIVHLPLGLATLLPLAAFVAIVAIARGLVPARTWLAIVALQVLVVGSGLVALQTGEEEEERLETVLDEAAVDRHEDLAKIFVVVSAAGLVLGAAAYWLGRTERRAGLAKVLRWVTAFVAAVALGISLEVGHRGGQLVFGRDGVGSVPASAPAREHSEH